MMASMRDGSGQHCFALFNEYGLMIKGLEHYSTHGRLFQQTGMVDTKIFRNIPKEFEQFVQEPAFITGETSFCVWTINNEKGWLSHL